MKLHDTPALPAPITTLIRDRGIEEQEVRRAGDIWFVPTTDDDDRFDLFIHPGTRDIGSVAVSSHERMSDGTTGRKLGDDERGALFSSTARQIEQLLAEGEI